MRSMISKLRAGARGAGAARRCPLRVLGCNEMFPLMSETYINDELEALALNGAELALYRNSPSISPMPVSRHVYMDLDAAIAEFQPDLLFLHWANFAASVLPRIEATGLPWALRVHSFDYDPPTVAWLRDHPSCVGVWAYPAHAREVPGTYPLPPLFTSVPDEAATVGPRDVVLSASAGLPKKDWDTLLDAFGRLPDLDRRLIVAITNGLEGVPSELATRLTAYERPPLLQINTPRETVIDLMCRAAVLVYTLVPEMPVAMPMSVVEGLCCGASVIVPDTPEAHELAGPHARGYRTAEDIAAHVREAIAGGPAIEAERRENMRYGRERYANPELFARFAEEVFTAVQRWRATRVAPA
jgi:glycosyltransferase involved in cell wall biosynthesis